MGSWQKRVRLAVAVFGIACVVVVYVAFKDRQIAAAPAAIERLDPKAIFENTAGLLQQLRGEERDFEITFERQLTYADKRVTMFVVEVRVKNRGGRDFVVAAREAESGPDQEELLLKGEVKLKASDGFELTTENATFNQKDGVVRAAGDVTFSKGRMNGSGRGMTYDKNGDVVSVAEQAHVTLSDEAGNVTMDFNASTATLDRLKDVLTVDGNVHVLREEQVLDADRATARLTPDTGVVTFIELRGNARVEGGSGSLDAMSARDIDLDYTEDGTAIERVVLTGGAAIAMTGQDGAAGRSFHGEFLDLQLAPDGAVRKAVGKDNTRLTLPTSGEGPARTITSRTFDASGETGKGLTSARFEVDVVFREEVSAKAPRIARSRTLQVSLADDAVTSAVFTGSATFEDQGLTAGAAEARYSPEEGSLHLNGRDPGGGPHVADEQVSIEANAIDVMLESRRMEARGLVETTLQPRSAAARAGRAAGAPAQAGTRLPGLLQQNQPANVTSDMLEYAGADGNVEFVGNAHLWQKETSVRANRITVDQSKGDLLAAGSARSTIVLDGSTSIGRAEDIRYDDARRMITYVAAPPPVVGRGAVPPGSTVVPPPPPAPGTVAPPADTIAPSIGRVAPLPVAPVREAQMGGSQGDLHAQRIEVFLAETGSGVQRVEAHTNVRATIDTRVATGSRLTYHTADERYDMSGTAAAPVKVVDRCREVKGKTLTFFKSAARMIVDGNEEFRAQTTGGGTCAPVPSR